MNDADSVVYSMVNYHLERGGHSRRSLDSCYLLTSCYVVGFLIFGGVVDGSHVGGV